ncbi:MAG: M23 family metallopeptidase [Alistipes senegalensis]|nr:M23 family metallopeptidase [Bacteroides cellulosilyticus]MCM1351324.1 M23 family metallopeptidase [Alistipes senegalensis]
MKLLFTTLCMTCSLLTKGSTLDTLLNMAQNYHQIEKAVMLLKRPDPTVDRIPCIPPLRATDIQHIRVSSTYGIRLHPILNEYKHHSGIDLPGYYGERVYATANGIVESTGETALIGKFIRLRHAYGFSTLYGHLSAIAVVIHDNVRIGQIIGYIGNTGRSTGPHLHYGISKNGREQDPLPYCYLYFQWQKMLKCEGKR